jgi:hypothetical protein
MKRGSVCTSVSVPQLDRWNRLPTNQRRVDPAESGTLKDKIGTKRNTLVIVKEKERSLGYLLKKRKKKALAIC